MEVRALVSLLLVLGWTATGCAPSRPAFRVPASRSGTLHLAADGLRFVPCGEDGPGEPLADLPDSEATALLREFGSPADGITALVRTAGSRLVEIRYAGGEGLPCAALPRGGDVVAAGNEPFWTLEVEGDRATLRTPEELDGVTWEDGAWTHPEAGRWTYRARRRDGEATRRIVLELVEERCADSMSGARYPFRAILERDGRRMDGCALEGRAAQEGSSGARPGP